MTSGTVFSGLVCVGTPVSPADPLMTAADEESMPLPPITSVAACWQSPKNFSPVGSMSILTATCERVFAPLPSGASTGRVAAPDAIEMPEFRALSTPAACAMSAGVANASCVLNVSVSPVSASRSSPSPT